jgi:pyruvate kinase
MARICETAEFALNVEDTYRTIKKANLATLNAAEALAMSAVKISMDLPMVTAIIVPTQSGATAELVAKYRPGVPIIALTESDITARRCMLSRNIVPFVVESKLTDAELIKRGVAACVSNKWSQVGEMVVVVHGAQGIVSGIMNRITINPVADFL